MGALCSCCKGGHGASLEDGGLEMSKAQRNGKPRAQQRQKRSRSGAETEEDRAKAAEAKHQAGLAAQRRAEDFDKSAAGRAARKVAAELAKPPPPPRGEPVLKWQMG